jgi:hypothetical protein
MNKQKIFGLLVSALLAGTSLSGCAQSVEKSLAGLTACDARFFTAVAQEQTAWRKRVELAGTDTLAWFNLPDRRSRRGNSVPFTTPAQASGLTITHYVDDASAIDFSGRHYAWGFKVAGSVDTVMQSLRPLVRDARRVRRDDGRFFRTEVKLPGMPWLASATTLGSMPKPLTAQRTFLVEQDAELPNSVRVVCLLHGAVSADLLRDLRPDIDAKAYPANVDVDLFSKIAPSVEVVQAVRSASENNSKWAPKFRRLTYAYQTGRGRFSEVVENNGDGLVTITEDYTSFKIKRLSSGGLVQLKARMNDGSSSVYLTDSLTLSLPEEFNSGDGLSFTQTITAVPGQVDSPPKITGMDCTVGEAFDASEIFATLAGRAIALRCLNDKGEPQGRALLETLGLVVIYTRSDDSSRSAQPRYTRFDVER